MRGFYTAIYEGEDRRRREVRRLRETLKETLKVVFPSAVQPLF